MKGKPGSKRISSHLPPSLFPSVHVLTVLLKRKVACQIIGMVFGLSASLALANSPPPSFLLPLPPKALFFCNKAEYRLELVKVIKLIEPLPKSSFIYDVGQYVIYIQSDPVLKEVEQESKYWQQTTDAAFVDARNGYLKMLRSMRADVRRGGFSDIRKYSSSYFNVEATVERLLTQGGVSVLNKSYIWTGRSYRSETIGAVIKYNASKPGQLDEEFPVYCDPLGGMVMFGLPDIPLE
ncbi:MAG: hypothetical protein ABUL58_00825 [Steroidobacter sp.]